MFSSLGRMHSPSCAALLFMHVTVMAMQVGLVLCIFTNDTHVFHNLRSGRRHVQWGDSSDICIRPRRRNSCPQHVGLPVGHVGPLGILGPVGPVGPVAHPFHVI